MADILNQALKDANYGVSGKNANPSVYYKITAYSFTRPDPTTDDIEYSITIASYMNSGGSMGSGTPLDLKVQLQAVSSGNIIFDKYIKQSASWTGKGDNTACAVITLTGTANLIAEGAQTIKFMAYRPNQNGDVIDSSNAAPGKTIGSGEIVNSSYTMNFPTKSIEPTEPYYVNINSTWIPCAIKVNVVGEGYLDLGLTSDYYDLADFNQSMYEKYNVGPQGEPELFTAVQSGHYPDYGIPVESVPDNAWGGYNGTVVAWELYMKSNNVKQWVGCELTPMISTNAYLVSSDYEFLLDSENHQLTTKG